MKVTQKKYRRTLNLDPDFDGQTRYRHDNGWIIKKMKRDWSTRGLTRGATHQAALMYWWEIYRSGSGGWREVARTEENFSTAVAWCDNHHAKDYRR